jgi:hypothetical protein
VLCPAAWGKGVALTTITLYKPGEASIRYTDPTNITLENGVLSFYWTKEITGNKQKVITTVPFLIQQDIAGNGMSLAPSEVRAVRTGSIG